MKKLVWLMTLLALIVGTSPSAAEPYEIVAKLLPLKGGAAKPVDLVVTEGAAVPRDVPGYVLDGLYIRVKSDDISKAALADLRNIVVTISWDHGGAKPIHRNVALPAAGDTLLLGAAALGGRDSVERLTLTTEAKFSSAFLCAKETEFRQKNAPGAQADVDAADAEFLTFLKAAAPATGGAKAAGQRAGAAPPPRKLTPDERRAAALVALYPLKDAGGKLIAYSFCADVRKVVDWSAAANAGKPAGTAAAAADVAALEQNHKAALLKRLLPYIEKDLGVTKIHHRAHAAGVPPNVLVEAVHRFAVLKTVGSQLSIVPQSTTQHHDLPLTQVLDQDAKLYLRLDDGFCNLLLLGCSPFVANHIEVVVKGKDQHGADVERKPKIRSLQDNRAELALDLREFLNQTITIQVVYLSGENRLVLIERSADVENLGMTFSFPVISEAGAFFASSQKEGWNPTDIEYKSSLPISWAYNLDAGDGQHVAITLPFMIGYNPEAAPNLSDYFRIYAHMSAILPVASDAEGGTEKADTESEGDAQFAVGAGVSLIRVFAFGWGVATDTGAQYLMVGLSPPDLAKLGDL